MKSFLQEIEDKFVELEEATPDADKIKAAAEANDELNISLAKTAELTKQITGEAFQDEEIDESHCNSHNEEELEEASNTAGVAAYNIPAAFAKPGKWKNKDKTYETVQEAMDRKYERLIESYRQFSRGDKKMTPENKIKRTIQEVSKKLKEIETLVKHTSKLKIESGMSRNEYGPRTEKALNKISEKLIKIAERVRAIGE